MNISRRKTPGMRIRKFHDGGKAHEHPHSDTTNYITSAAERINRQLFKESGGEQNPNSCVSSGSYGEVADNAKNSTRLRR